MGQRGLGLGDGELGLGSAPSQCLCPWSVKSQLISMPRRLLGQLTLPQHLLCESVRDFFLTVRSPLLSHMAKVF